MTHKRNICLICPSKRARGPNFPIALLSVMCYWKNAGGMILWTQWRCSASAAFWRGRFLKICFNFQVAIMLYCGSMFQKQGFFLFYFVFSQSLDVTESQEVLFYVFLLKCLFLSIHGWGCFVCCLLHTLPDSGSVWRFQQPDSWKWKELPRQWKQAVCSCPDQQNGWGHRWVFSQVDFSSDPASLWLETWEPRLE